MEIVREIKEKVNLSNPKNVLKYLEEFRNQDREYFIVIGLDSKNQALYREINTIGTLNQSLIHPREVFKKAIMMNCSSIIVAHNHPSGDSEPSYEDKKVTDILRKAGELVGIKVLDHLILGEKTNYSFSEHW